MLILLLMLISCYHLQVTPFNNTYSFTDKSGSFELMREGGHLNKDFVIKEKISDGKVDLEKSVLIMDAKFYPKQSEYIIYLDESRNVSKATVKGNSLIVDYTGSSEGHDEITLNPNSYFYGSIPDVFKTFINKSINRNTEPLSLDLIWEGYPFIQETYTLAKNITTPAKFYYSGKMEDLYRFTLETEDQTIFYLMDESLKMIKKLWVSQGLVMEIK